MKHFFNFMFIVFLILCVAGAWGQTPDINNTTWGGWTDRGSSVATGVYAKGGKANDYEIYTAVFFYNSSNPVPGTSSGFANGNKVLGIGIKFNNTPTGYPVIKLDPNNNSYAPSADGITNGRSSFSSNGDLGDAVVQFGAGSGSPSEITIRSANPYNSSNDYYLPNGGNWGGGSQPGFRGINPAVGVWKTFFDLDQITTEFGAGGTRNSSGPYLTAFAGTITFAIGGLGGTEAVVQGLNLLPPVHNVTQNTYFFAIQPAIDAANNGDVIDVAAGTYNENLAIAKRLTLNGSGTTTTIVTSAAANTPVISVTTGGVSATDRLIISNLKVTGATGGENPGAGILVQSGSASGYYTFSSVLSTGNQGSGIAFNSTASVTDVLITNSSLSNNGIGLRIATAVPSFDGLAVTDCQMNNNASSAFTYNPSGVLSNVGTNFSFTNTTFANNSQAGISNQHDLSFYGFHGNATLTNVSVTCSNGQSTTHKAYGIVFTNASTYAPAGTITLNGVTCTGVVGKGALSFQLYSDLSGVSMNNVDVSGCTAPWGQVIIDHQGPTGPINLGNTTLKSIVLWKNGNVNATATNFKHISTGTLLSRSVSADCYQIEDQVVHKIDLSTLGFVRVKTGEVFVTPNSFASPYTTAPSIQRGVDAASTGDIVNVATGTYVEGTQVIINKNVSVVGADKLTTIITPSANTGNSGDARGWFLVNAGFTFNLSNVTLDGSGHLVYMGILNKGNGTIDNCRFTNIKYNESGPDYAGIGMSVRETPNMNVNVTNCEFSGMGRIGVHYRGPGTTGTISGSTFTGKGAGNWLDYGIEAGGAPLPEGGAHLIISNNTVTNCQGVASVDGSTSAGILVTTYFGPGTQATITGCTLSDNTDGIAVG